MRRTRPTPGQDSVPGVGFSAPPSATDPIELHEGQSHSPLPSAQAQVERDPPWLQMPGTCPSQLLPTPARLRNLVLESAKHMPASRPLECLRSA